MNLLDRLERKLGRYAIRGIMRYLVVLYAAGLFLGMLAPGVYDNLLALDFSKVADGQVWRLITFIIPISYMKSIFWTAITVYIYYMFGESLENAWGPFRLNMYLLVGVLFNILGYWILYMLGITVAWPSCVDVICQTLFFAFASIYPNSPIYLYFLIPLKAKYVAWFFGLFYIFNIVTNILSHHYLMIIPMVASIANFLLFFFASRNYHRISPGEIKRKATYRRQVNKAKSDGNVVQFQGRNVVTRHKCAVCGRTELDGENLEFRFCSKCDGNYEYCMDHLFTHEHVHKD